MDGHNKLTTSPNLTDKESSSEVVKLPEITLISHFVSVHSFSAFSNVAFLLGTRLLSAIS